TINGCRWLFAGVDGEYIPVKDIEPVKFHKMADCRYRGQCNEGAEYQPNMMEAIDFTPKIGLNIFMIEFDIPLIYYSRYYDHPNNETNREPEPVTREQVLQWKRQCEAELSMRGLQCHDMGHGWAAESFGIDSSAGWVQGSEEVYPPEAKPFVAMTDGKRKFWNGLPMSTQFCMSRDDGRAMFVETVCKYAALAKNVDYLHVWLADGSHNHCECDECRKRTPSDWYIILMNELDAELTKRKINSRIVFCCYVDTTWAPKTEKLNNPDRFSLLVGPMFRSYTESVDANKDLSTMELPEYVLNETPFALDVNEYVAHAQNWVKTQHLPFFVYEYHLWHMQYRDVAMLDSAKVLYNDIIGYRKQGGSGIIEDCSQRSFFPNGFRFSLYGNTLFDTSLSFEEQLDDYFRHAYGEDYKEVIAFFEKLSKLIDFRFANKRKSGLFNEPQYEAGFLKVPELVDSFAPFVEAHKNMPKRVQTVAYRMLRRYLEYCKGISRVFALKCVGNDEEANKEFNSFAASFGKYELEMERWYDHYLATAAFGTMVGKINLQML
ncbi:MAG: DUF4838 domain-containing protein, partial [Clostridia bacterium]|nr:DUF4838 domain-containing protein [Clostridia bacterium]